MLNLFLSDWFYSSSNWIWRWQMKYADEFIALHFFHHCGYPSLCGGKTLLDAATNPGRLASWKSGDSSSLLVRSMLLFKVDHLRASGKRGVGRAISHTKSVARVSFGRKTETSESQLGCAKMAFFLFCRPNSCVLPYSVDKYYVISVSSSSWSWWWWWWWRRRRRWWWWWWWWWWWSPSPSPPSSKQPSSRFSPIS